MPEIFIAFSHPDHNWSSRCVQELECKFGHKLVKLWGKFKEKTFKEKIDPNSHEWLFIAMWIK